MGSLSLLQGIFPTQESNQSLLHCRLILYQLSYHKLSLSKSPTFPVPLTFGRWLYFAFTEKRESNSDSFHPPFHQPMYNNSYKAVLEVCFGSIPTQLLKNLASFLSGSPIKSPLYFLPQHCQSYLKHHLKQVSSCSLLPSNS